MAQALTRWLAAALLVAALTGCSGAVRWNEPETRRPPPAKTSAPRAPRSGVHVVKAGESLYAIALRYQLDAKDIARWNRLGDGELIFPGQRLRLTGPAATAGASGSGASGGSAAPRPAPSPPANAPSFAWPAVGKVQRSTSDAAGAGTGVNILGDVGSQVVAAADGRVVYSGSGLIGYGNLIIVKHGARYLTAYGYNDSLLVKEGDSVRRGQAIARMGRGPDRAAALHFEIRLDGKPVDPLRYLDPSRATTP
ncbi:MAG: peptidoglycan DD-metalloendopeptidase family protein [Pseudomonadota bacterium]